MPKTTPMGWHFRFGASVPSLCVATTLILSLLLAGIHWTACSAASTASSPPTQAAKPLAGKLPSGATYSVPKGWWQTVGMPGPGVVTLEDPERSMRLWLVEVSKVQGKDAVDVAWRSVGKDAAALPIKQQVSPPSTSGWDRVTHVVYEASPTSGRASGATAFQLGSVTYVALIDGPIPTLGKRGAQIRTILGNLKAPGLKGEHFADRVPHKLLDERAATFDRFIASSLEKAKLPGAAVAVVQDGQVVFAKGYGVRELGKPGAIAVDTPFMIGSTTKSMTSLLIAKLADEGLLTWDTPVHKLLPGFKVGSEAFGKRITMRHSMCACTGLPRQDMEMLFEFGDATPEKRLAELAGMTPTTGFGETFQYSNPLVSAGGYAAARTAFPKRPLFEAYTAAMQSRVFGPLGMTRTTFDMARVAKEGRHAFPHGATYDGAYTPLPLAVEHAVLTVAPAGGAWSTIGDLARLMLVEMGEGETTGPNKARVFGRDHLLERRKPGIRVSDRSRYGLALMIQDRYGLQSVGHGGATLGFSTTWVFYPEQRLGLVVLTNAQGAGVFNHYVHRRLLELVFDGAEQAEKGLAHALSTREQARVKRRQGLKPDAAWDKAIVGQWSNKALGPMTIATTSNGLVADMGEWSSPAARQVASDGSSSMVLTGPPLAGVPFLHDPVKGVLTLKTGQQSYVFKRDEAGKR